MALEGQDPSFNLILDPTFVTGIDMVNQYLISTRNNFQTVNWNGCRLNDLTPTESLDWNDRLLRFTDGTTAVLNWSSLQLIDSTSNLSLDWGNRLLDDAAAVNSLDWNARNMFDSSGSVSLSYGSRLLNGAVGIESIDWGNRLAVDSTGNNSIDWANRKLVEPGGLSMDWGARELWCAGGVQRMLEYSSQIGVVLNNGFVTPTMQVFTAGGNVTINNENRGLYYDPASTQLTATITLPSSVALADGQEILLLFGGTIVTGAVVTTLVIAPNTGQSINGTPIIVANAGVPIKFKWRSSINTWYPI